MYKQEKSIEACRPHIIIIDSGVKISHKLFANHKINGFAYSGDKTINNFDDKYGHGTAIYGIISKCNDFCDITNIKVDGIETGISADELFGLLEYVYKNIDADIINLSFGVAVCDDLNGLYEMCNKLTVDKGVIIISAFSNVGCMSYPAAFDNVIGVMNGIYNSKVNEFGYIEDTIVNLTGKGGLQRVAWINPDYLILDGNSLACAHATVQSALFMRENNKILKKSEVLEKFKNIAIRKHNFNKKTVNEKPNMIKKAVLFPFNKEMHSLIRYNNLLNFEIVDVYDSKYAATVGSTTRQLMKDNSVTNLRIKNIDNIDWDNWDTLILGHTDELSSLIHKDNFKKNIVDNAITNGKQIYSFDDLSAVGYNSNSSVYFPKISDNDLPPNRFGMLYRILKPVVGVFGTSSRQGKFTLQLKLREILMRQGYNIGQIGTEPSALLYGMDYCFPMGYNATVHIKEFNTIRYLNYIINDLCMKEKDIILVGSQSGTIPYDTGNIAQFTVPQYNFLMGTQPDCVILCVNPFDEIEYVKRTVNFIESSVECNVVAIVVFPVDIKDDWTGIYGGKKELNENKYIKIKTNLFEKFNIPIFKLGAEDDINTLVDLITNFFVE
jgi:uncharacterized NAD-dependent epimerase/dehydratase family protein